MLPCGIKNFKVHKECHGDNAALIHLSAELYRFSNVPTIQLIGVTVQNTRACNSEKLPRNVFSYPPKEKINY